MRNRRPAGGSARDRAALPFESDDERWTAVVDRDPRAEGHFVFGVTTTGVYCRPGCPARRPRRENAKFFGHAGDAERAGFRPCRRCLPNGASVRERHAAAVVRACRLIETAEEVPDLSALSEAAGMSRFHFHRVFKATTGLTPRAYASARRAERVRAALREGATVTRAIHDAGFGSASPFYEGAEKTLGMRPARYRRGGQAETIRFALGQCSLGAILVAATAKGVCRIHLGDDPEALLRDCEDQFAHADLVGGDEAFERLVARAIALIEEPARGHDLPLDVRGTAFQQRVWQALSEIPAGSTETYAAVAARIGAPGAARAVARACAANPLAVAVPCHRVVRRDGELAGYRWGVERKAALLEREAGV